MNDMKPEQAQPVGIYARVGKASQIAMNKKYHYQVGIPESVVADVRTWNLDLVWSSHAKREAVTDKYGVLPPSAYPRRLEVGTGWDLIEVETGANGCAQKVVIRREVDDTRSLVLVVLRDGPHTGFIKTVWTNLNTDNHGTLDRSKFDKP